MFGSNQQNSFSSYRNNNSGNIRNNYPGNVRGRGRGAPFQQRGNFRGGGSNQRFPFNNGNRNFKDEGIGFKKIDDLCRDMDELKILSGSSDLLKFVQGKGFNLRLNEPWPEIEKQTKFLKIIVSTASATQADLISLTHSFLSDVLASKFLQSIFEKIPPLAYGTQLKDEPVYAEFVGYTVKLLLLGLETLPSKMDTHLAKVHTVHSTLAGITQLLDEKILYDLEALKEKIGDRYTKKTTDAENIAQAQKLYKRRFAEDIHGPPPDDFRKLNLIPTTEDMNIQNQVYLRPAKVDGKYESDEHYLDVQFRLLREDLIRPLREGIGAYQQGGSRNSDLFVYKNVEVEPPKLHQQTGELIVYASIQILKRMRYLVNVETNVQIPAYLSQAVINFSVLFKNPMKSLRLSRMLNAHNLSRYVAPTDLGMDESQFGALVNTLQSDLAIIQGPPGTGKTYMGLQIAQLLFSNEQLWYDNRPMLVVCYTNHALDQFLEGISKFLEEGIVRVGSRSKNPAMEKYMIHNLRTWKDPNLKFRSNELRNEVRLLQEKLESNSAALKELSSRFTRPSHLTGYYSSPNLRYHKSSSNLGMKLENSTITLMSTWLTTFNLNDECPIDMSVIKYLMEQQIPEIQAKNALLCAYQGYEDFTPQSVYNCLMNGSYGEVSATQLQNELGHWPTIRQINGVIRHGFDPNTAAEILISCQNNVQVVNREITLSRNFIANRKPVSSKLPEAPEGAEVEQLTELDVEADDDNRIIMDGNFMRDILGKNNGNPKKKKSDWYDKEAITPSLEHIVNAPAMTAEEANNVRDIWLLPLQSRWRLYQRWISQARNNLREKIQKEEEIYGEKMKQLQALKSMADVDVMKRAKVIGLTTTGAARNQSALRTLRPRIVIVEEAAEVLEAHLLSSLTIACEHLILIGDHKQLRPSPAVFELSRKYNMDISLFERLVNLNFPFRMLQNQHRMCTDISRTLMPHFYEDLRDDPEVLKRKPVRGVTKNLMFISHSQPEVSERDIKSHSNPFEAKFALKLAKYFLQQGYKGEQITVLCTYLDQLLFLRKTAPEIIGGMEKVTIESVDNYQGEESDIIILSLVRSNNPEGKIGFLNIPNRVCVALSRARMGLYVICNMDFLAKHSPLWKQIQESAEEADALGTALTVQCQMHKNEQEITCGEDFGEKCLEGGCDKACGTRLNCGHTCSKPCHVYDMDHLETKCMKPCAETCPAEYKHPCRKRCYQECGNCEVKVPKSLRCGHTKLDSCFLKPENVVCIEACRKRLSCGHRCDKLCSESCTESCQTIVQKKLPLCGHSMEMKCSDDPKTFKCMEKVVKEWPICNHKVRVRCYVDVEKTYCPKPCKTALPGCEHLCEGSCGACRNGRLHIQCNKDCKKPLICGHLCESKCSNSCPPCQKLCQTACAHSQCGKETCKGERMKKVRGVDKPTVAPRNKQHVKKKPNEKEANKDPTSDRRCGDPCPPCKEDCLNRCSHRSCDKKCSDPCSVEPCNEPCRKLLPCNPKKKKKPKQAENSENNGEKSEEAEDDDSEKHYCIGVCGEECLKICKICNPDKFAALQEIFLGNEEEENAMFLQLKDCGHIFELTGLDQWIESKLPQNDNNTVEIVDIRCPRCKTPIRKSKRYIKFLNQRSADIEQVKLQIRGLTADERKAEHKKFAAELYETASKNLNSTSYLKVLGLKQKLMEEPPSLMTKNWFILGRNMLNILKQLLEHQNRAHENLRPQRTRNFTIHREQLAPPAQVKLNICDQIKGYMKISDISEYINEDFNALILQFDIKNGTETMMQQLANEVSRFGFLTEAMIYMNQLYRANNDLPLEHGQTFYLILKKLFGSLEFGKEYEEQLWKDFKAIVKAHPAEGFGVTEKERIEINAAMDGSVSKWYKCPNGHMYGIGDCGMAMVESRCPECKATIGGTNHSLQAGNSEATNEMRQGLPPIHIPDPFVVRFGREF